MGVQNVTATILYHCSWDILMWNKVMDQPSEWHFPSWTCTASMAESTTRVYCIISLVTWGVVEIRGATSDVQRRLRFPFFSNLFQGVSLTETPQWFRLWCRENACVLSHVFPWYMQIFRKHLTSAASRFFQNSTLVNTTWLRNNNKTDKTFSSDHRACCEP